MSLSISLLQKQQMHYLLTAQSVNFRLFSVQQVYLKNSLQRLKRQQKNSAVLKSANMSLGINTLMKLIQEAAKVLATAGFDMEIVEKASSSETGCSKRNSTCTC